MNRLTSEPFRRKSDDSLENYKVRRYGREEWETSVQKVINKLGKLEDLEEELGCPLEVVIKAIEDGIIAKSVNDKFEGSTLWVDRPSFEKALPDNEIMDFEEPRLIKCINWCFFCSSGCYRGCVRLKDYKKTWLLKGEKDE